ncbi:MAG TPA: CIA30 family protein [Steroidobacteraceae bacterium]|nr:CIA30 family protein [Steroidobacteraceae bacterium]
MKTAGNMSATRLWSAYFGEMHFELIKSLRTPAFAVPTLFFPIMFYLLFGVFLGSMRGNSAMSQYTFATYGVFGAMGPGLFGFGVSLAIEREQGLLTLKQALPQPPGAYLLARAAMAMLFVAIISILLTLMAVFAGNVPLTFGQAARLFAIDVFGALPFCAIGMFLGALVSGAASPAIVNLIFLPMAFLSGLWLPLQFMPQFLQDIAPVWPAYHLAQMALATVGAPSAGSTAGHVAVLAAVTLGFFLLAMRRMHGSGFRLLGARPKRTLVLVGSGCAAILALALSGVFGGPPATSANGSAVTDSTDAAAGTPAPEAPPGVPAPAAGVISDFDAGSMNTAFGVGWNAVGDDMRGGNSTATQRLVDGGANGSKGALEVNGVIGGAIQYPFAGTMFFPQAPPMEGLMDFSARKTLSFLARGDGKRYMVMVISGLVTDAIPLMYEFEAGSEWREVRLEFAGFVNIDFGRVRAIGIGTMGPVGAFSLQIDDVRLE